MSEDAAIFALLKSFVGKNYYELLGVAPDAGAGTVRSRFHKLAAKYHPDGYANSAVETRAAVVQVFKRIVEAYQVLSHDELRVRYERALARGELRIDPMDKGTIPPPALRTLVTLAHSQRAKAFAREADRLIGEGKLKEAKMQLKLALSNDGDNPELMERLNILQETLAILG